MLTKEGVRQVYDEAHEIVDAFYAVIGQKNVITIDAIVVGDRCQFLYQVHELAEHLDDPENGADLESATLMNANLVDTFDEAYAVFQRLVYEKSAIMRAAGAEEVQKVRLDPVDLRGLPNMSREDDPRS